MIPSRIAVVIPVWALFVCPAFAEPQPGDIQPDSLHLGAVYVGATVEASFMLLGAGTDPKTKLDVRVPRFVKVRNKRTFLQGFANTSTILVTATVEIAIDTKVAGEFKGEVTVTLGQIRVKLPVSVTVKARRPGLSPLLIAATPFEVWITKHSADLQVWTDLVKDSTLDVNYLLFRERKSLLRDFNLEKFVGVFLPSEALCNATAEDIKRVREYAEKGGWVVVAANHFYHGSVRCANEVLDGYGLQMQDEEGDCGQNDIVIRKEAIDPDLVKMGVESLRFARASPIRVTDAKKARVLVRAVGVGKGGDGFVVRAKAGKGTVIALGHCQWWNWIAQGDDNAKLLRCLLTPW